MTTEILTRQEERILNLYRRGFRTKSIATQLGISQHTLRAHIRNLLHKTGAVSVVEAVILTLVKGKE